MGTTKHSSIRFEADSASTDVRYEIMVQSILEHHPGAVFSVNSQGKMQYHNPAATSLLPALQERLSELDARPLLSGEEFEIGKKWFKTRVFACSASGCFHVYLDDITHLRYLERDHDRLGQLFSELVSLSPMDIAIFDSRHRYLYLNGKGVKDAELRQWLIGKDDFDYCRYRNRPDDLAKERRKHFNKALRTRTGVHFVERFSNPTGDVHLMRYFHPVQSQSGETYVIGYAVDISEQMQHNDTMQETLKLVFDNNVLYSRLLHDFVHKLRQPLKSMEASLQLLHEEYLSEMPDEAREMLGFMSDAWMQFQHQFKHLNSQISRSIHTHIFPSTCIVLRDFSRQLRPQQPENTHILELRCHKASDTVICAEFLLLRITEEFERLARHWALRRRPACSIGALPGNGMQWIFQASEWSDYFVMQLARNKQVQAGLNLYGIDLSGLFFTIQAQKARFTIEVKSGRIYFSFYF
jgi:PAS domain-containing protein